LSNQQSIKSEQDDGWIETYCRSQFWPLTAEGYVYLNDIAHHLALRNRFSGATCNPYSVAQHSVLVARVLEPYGRDVQRQGLMHDAAEAYLPDIPRPIKQDVYLWCNDTMKEFCEVEDAIMQRVCEYAGCDWPLHPAVKEADNRVCATERRDLMCSHHDWGVMDEIEPYSFTIKPWKWQKAERKFLQMFEELL
jgi:5'-deoxynucleotidase YfbR-like HD superfamily hydrolase